MHVVMATSTEPSYSAQHLLIMPLLLTSHVLYGPGDEMMSRQSIFRAVTKLTSSRSFELPYVTRYDMTKEISEFCFMGDDRIIFQAWPEADGNRPCFLTC